MEFIRKREIFPRQLYYLSLLLGLFYLIMILTPSFCMAQEQMEQHIYDNAEYFSAEEIQQLESLCLEYGEVSDSNIILLIEDGVKNGSWKRYIEDFYDAHEDALNAAILLLDVNEEERRIEIQGYGEMEYYMSDARIEDIIDEMIDDLKAGEYYAALSSFPMMVKDCYDRGYAADARTHTEADNENYDPYYYEKEMDLGRACLFALPAALVIGGVVTGIMVYQSGGKNTTTFHSYMDEGRKNLIGRYDRYMYTTTSKHKKEVNNSSHGGGGGGVSSGGSSHSGGGRSF